MRLTTIGPRGYIKGVAVATLSYTPLYDRSARILRVVVTNPSADDNWIFSCQGQELARFPVNGVGSQYMLGGTSTQFPQSRDIFDFIKSACGFDLTYPVPQGMTFTVASAAGATANVAFEFVEFSAGDVQAGEINGQSASRYIMPVFLVPSATVSGTSPVESDFASQIAANWIPSLFGTVQIPAAYTIKIIALFLEGQGRNTYSGSADHQSVTDHFALDYQGQRMFTRTAGDGIPIVGKASATGSANTVYGFVESPFPAFQLVIEPEQSVLDYPIILAPGSQAHFRLGTTGDTTGNATYAKAYACLLCDIAFTGMVPA